MGHPAVLGPGGAEANGIARWLVQVVVGILLAVLGGLAGVLMAEDERVDDLVAKQGVYEERLAALATRQARDRSDWKEDIEEIKKSLERIEARLIWRDGPVP